jgi:hypothetical protein
MNYKSVEGPALNHWPLRATLALRFVMAGWSACG